MEWRNIYRGFLMGISDLIPGVSGGTVAFVLGIYDRLLKAISGFFSLRWKQHIGFLLPLGIGIGAALLSLSKVIDYLLAHHFEPTQFFFMGLIIGVLPFIMKEADVKNSFASSHYIVMIVFALLLASMAFIKPSESADPITTLSVLTVIGLFFSGWLASMAMLLPGISGSFLLLLLGVYSTAINALSTLNLPIIAVIGGGVIVGFIVSSRGIQYLLTHFTNMTYAIIIGLILGSIVVIFPGVPTGSTMIISLIMLLLGLLVSSLFSMVSRT
ncbi:DUF368 domain-containing protein [Pueribacillus theae]|uniref:DUF368 domain-containing protein n=1 Tax=Pueribacillus theae TaxID=2171751 RepID=A0A2U1JRT3_9BACI|nr:DUF368 domain-containing protein [Pueribacillus theae]PWA07920.1 DUF368 domain-containing protein [Pueribacillus theae]